MRNMLFNRRHIKEYLLYGGISALVYLVPVFIFLYSASYYNTGILYIGCILFMFVIMIYSIKLAHRRPEYKSAWMMLIAGHMAVLVGIAISVIISMLLCFVFIPGFMSGDSADNFLRHSPDGLNINNSGTLQIIFLTAVLGNFGAAAFISTLVSYVVKPNQTKDVTPKMFEEPAAPQDKNPAF